MIPGIPTLIAPAVSAGACTRGLRIRLTTTSRDRRAHEAHAHRRPVSDPHRLGRRRGDGVRGLGGPGIRTVVLLHPDLGHRVPLAGPGLRLDREARGRVALPLDTDELGGTVDRAGPPGCTVPSPAQRCWATTVARTGPVAGGATVGTTVRPTPTRVPARPAAIVFVRCRMRTSGAPFRSGKHRPDDAPTWSRRAARPPRPGGSGTGRPVGSGRSVPCGSRSTAPLCSATVPASER